MQLVKMYFKKFLNIASRVFHSRSHPTVAFVACLLLSKANFNIHTAFGFLSGFTVDICAEYAHLKGKEEWEGRVHCSGVLELGLLPLKCSA